MIHAAPGEAVAALLLAAALVLGPLPFGAVLPGARTVLALAVLTALAVEAVARGPSGGLRAGAVPALAVAAVGALGLLQSMPWPRPLVALVAPRLATLWRGAAEVLADPALAPSLSLAPEVSRRTGFFWLAAAAALAAGTAVGGNRVLRRLLGGALLGVALFEVAFGADNWFRGGSRIWGRVVPGDPGRLRGTFVNPDHLSFFLGIAVCGCFAWLWWAVRRWGRRGSLDRKLVATVLPALGFVMTFVGLAFTGSRAGLLAIGAGIVAQALVLALRYRRWQAALVGVAALALAFAGLVLFGLGAGVERWMSTSAYEIAWGARMRVWGASLRLWLELPLTGSGLGTFRQAFPLVQPPDLELAWHHAHSDVLEVLVTTGVAGAAVLVLGIVAAGRRLAVVVDRGRRSEERAAGLAAIGALVAAGFHSVVDFGLALPANAITLAVVVGLALGCPVMTALEAEAERAQRGRRRRGDRPVPAEAAATATQGVALG